MLIKKMFTAYVVMACFIHLRAQETYEEGIKRNDAMISPIELIATPMLNISYERLLNEKSGVGINGIFYFRNDSDDSHEDSKFSQVSAYYRMYFGRKYAAGFFVEGFIPVTMTTDIRYYSSKYDDNRRSTTIGAGVGFGGKWVVKRNFVFEASMGIARRFGKSNAYFGALTGKGMLGIGYRF